MTRYITGCDPGGTGGLVTIDEETGDYISHLRVRTIGAASRKRVDGREVSEYLRPFASGVLAIELVSSMPTDGGVQAFSFGKSLGSVIGVAECLGMSIIEISPMTWQKVALRGHKRTPKAMRKANCVETAAPARLR